VAYNVRFRDEAWNLFLALPTTMREQVVDLLAVLVETPIPPGVKAYEHVPDSYRADVDDVTVFYRIVGEEIDVVYLRPNS
jgi:mRNA-degrading endonuclease RelE of RelBE toxin-antitoxin system